MKASFKNLCLIFLIALVAGSANASELSFSAYHSQDQINQFMKDEAVKFPTLVHFHNLGKSLQGREISIVVISHSDPKNVPAIYLNGTHHGDEWSSTEGILGLMDYLITNQDRPDVAKLLTSYAIYLQPLVNPDGHAASTREDSLGRDPNRDYSYPLQADAASFKLPEIQLVKQLLDTIHPVAAAAYHSGIEEVLWSWCYTGTQTSSQNLLAKVSQVTAKSMGFDRFMQSYFDYATNGEFIDYAFMKFGTVALTFEVSVVKTPAPADLASIVNRSVVGAMAFMTAVDAAKNGMLDLSSDLSRGLMPSWGQLGKFGVRTGPRLE